jgi:hypothetical protein
MIAKGERTMPRCALSTTLRWISTAAALACAMLSADAFAYESPFVTAVARTSPAAYFRLESSDGRSMGGLHSFSSSGGVAIDAPGVDAASEKNSFARLNGRDGMISTSFQGGVGRAGSIMAWVNLARMPAEAHRILYIAGESQSGNDFDMQFEPDNSLRFYTGAGGNIRYALPPMGVVGQWHMVVATFDADRHTRVLYWDGVPVAADNDAGKAGKISRFTIGASTVWGGRWFDGGIDEVALWSKALTAEQVANFYAAATQGAPAPAAQQAAPPPPAGPITTTAQVEIEDANGKVPLKLEEKIALMFLTAIQSIEFDCQMRSGAACTMDQMVAGPKATDGSRINRLKFDPAADPNYGYSVKVNGKAWEAHADPKRQGLGGFYFIAKVMSPDAYYSPNGPAGPMDRQLTSRSISGDSFSVR